MAGRSAALALLVLAVAHPAAADEPAPFWTVLGPDGAQIVRTIARDGVCPRIDYDGFQRPMQTRVGPWLRFPVSVCEAPLPAIVARATLDGVAVPRVPAELRRIVVLGDSGCRIEPEAPAQSCADPEAWPFARVARAAAALAPDVVIHLGDYVRRRAPCPAGETGCAGSPFGDRQETWTADFLVPAAPLLAAAPWVVARGEQEDCARGGLGWFRFLDPRPRPVDCEGFTAPYAVALPGLDLHVVDTAYADDDRAVAPQVERHRAALAAVAERARPGAWLVAHKPLVALAPGAAATPGREVATAGATLRAAARDGVGSQLALVLSAHLRRFDVLGFGPEAPVQLVAGGAGAPLDAAPAGTLAGALVDGRSLVTGVSLATHGFLVLDRAAEGWSATLRDADGRVRLACTLSHRQVSCQP